MVGHIIQLSRGDFEEEDRISVRKVAGTRQMYQIGAVVTDNQQDTHFVLLDLLIRFKGIEVRSIEDRYALVVTNKHHYFYKLWDLIKGDFEELAKMDFDNFCEETYSTIVKNLRDRYTDYYDIYVWTEDRFCPLDDFVRQAEVNVPYFVEHTLAYIRK